MRYLPHTPEQIRHMLARIGVSSLSELFRSIPERLKLSRALELPSPLDETALINHFGELERRNQPPSSAACFLGAGWAQHVVPAAVDQLLLRGEFFTAYTPYQPECSQGTLQAIFEYQSLMAELTGCEVVNASMYDGASAAAEALLMAGRIGRKRRRVLIGGGVHPETLATCRTYLSDADLQLQVIPCGPDGVTDFRALESQLDGTVAAVLIQQPNFFGCLEPLPTMAELIHRAGALLAVSVLEPVSLGLLEAPAVLGADIVTGEGASLAGPPNFGGPGLGIFGCAQKHVWQMPGRLVGQTVDKDGRRGFVLTLAAREQHIRRARATSNICTNEGLCALAAAIHLALLGKEGFTELARINAANARAAIEKLERVPGVRRAFPGTPFFNEFTLRISGDLSQRLERAEKAGVVAGLPLDRFFPEFSDCLLVCVTELQTPETIERLCEVLEG